MKNLVILSVVFFSLFLTSCSDVTDSSMLTGPVLNKSVESYAEQTPSPVYPYPYLFSFNELKAVKYFSEDHENAIQFIIPDLEVAYSQLFVQVSFNQDISSRTYFVDKINLNQFKIDGITSNQIKDVKVFGYLAGSAESGVSPFQNNSYFNEVANSSWKIAKDNIIVDCPGPWPTSLKYIFAELITKEGNFFLFLQRPYSNYFTIPEYGRYGIDKVVLYGCHTLTEKMYSAK